MNQDLINAIYDKLDELRNVFEVYLDEHDTPEAETKVKAVLVHLDCSIQSLSEE